MSAERGTTYKGANRHTILDRPRPDGRRGLVADAGRGIGRVFAHALGEAGARVATAVVPRIGQRKASGEPSRRHAASGGATPARASRPPRTATRVANGQRELVLMSLVCCPPKAPHA
jgi:hypothetical protein